MRVLGVRGFKLPRSRFVLVFRSGWLVARMVLVGLIKKKNYLDGGGGATRWVTPQSVWFNTVGGAVGCAVALAKCLYFPSAKCYFILCGFDFIMDPGGWVRAVALNPRSQSWGDCGSCV